MELEMGKRLSEIKEEDPEVKDDDLDIGKEISNVDERIELLERSEKLKNEGTSIFSNGGNTEQSF